MVVIEVQLLAGRYVAIADNQKATPDARAEWPPHPARLYSALVAALHDRAPPDPLEREVLDKLAAHAPQIEASNVADEAPVPRRSVARVYVPANDMNALKPLGKLGDELAKNRAEFERASRPRRARGTAAPAAVQPTLLPNEKRFAQDLLRQFDDGIARLGEWRGSLMQRPEYRSERTFPCVVPDGDVIRFGWPTLDLSDALLDALARLVERVTRLGHSSSLVRCSVTQRIAPTLESQDDTDTADRVLRVPFADQLKRLEQAFEIHRAVKQRVLPSRPQAYRVVKPDEQSWIKPTRGLFSDRDWIVFAVETRNSVQLTRCVDVAKALHGALVKQVPGSVFVSGRDANGNATADPHLALIPLSDVGHEHAHGGVLGVALVMPHDTSTADRQTVLEALVEWELTQGDDGTTVPWLPLQLHGGTVLHVRRHEMPEPAGLRARTWCRAARRWLSVTPVALDRNPGNLATRSPNAARRAADAAREILREACVRIGLPAPLKVEMSLAPLLPGSAPVRAFDPFPREVGRLRRVRVHAELVFEQRVSGPVMLGAGRFFGLGLFRPVK